MKWIVHTTIPASVAKRFHGYSPTVQQLLYNRGFSSHEDAQQFFYFDYSTQVHDPFLLKHMRDAVDRVAKAQADKEAVAIYGDYDVDGVCGAVMLSQALHKIGFDPLVYLPDREKEGYGLNARAIDYLASKSVTLLIAVDCGTSNAQEIAHASRKGIDVIILDHHVPPQTLPSAKALINAKQKNETYPYKELCGTGVAFKFVDALSREPSLAETLTPSDVKWFLDLVALATIADRVEMLGENRVLVKYGLWTLARRKRIGLRELFRVAGLRPHASATDPMHVHGLSTYEVGFVLAPRINAAGRMDHANTAFELLNTNDESDAMLVADQLNTQNTKRQQRVKNALHDFLESDSVDREQDFLVHGVHARWPKGLLGLIASGMVQAYARPAFACQLKKGVIACSARSIPAVNIIQLISKHNEHLVNYGGHSQAAGFTISARHFDSFCKAINKEIRVMVSLDQLQNELHVDTELARSDITMSLYNDCMTFAPFGDGNPEPVFVTRGAKVVWHRLIGAEQQHQKVRLQLADGSTYGAIMFNFRSKQNGNGLQTGDSIDIAYTLNQSNWSGWPELEFKIVDYTVI